MIADFFFFKLVSRIAETNLKSIVELRVSCTMQCSIYGRQALYCLCDIPWCQSLYKVDGS